VLFLPEITSRGTTLFQRPADRAGPSRTPFFNTLTGCASGADYFSAFGGVPQRSSEASSGLFRTGLQPPPAL